MARKRIAANFEAAPHQISCPRCNGTGKVTPETISMGDRFRLCRERTGHTQAEICVALKVSRSGLANIENDKARPGLDTLVLAADVYQVSVDYLLGRSS
jgi:DNA-binding XRE family transcriptional regulator